MHFPCCWLSGFYGLLCSLIGPSVLALPHYSILYTCERSEQVGGRGVNSLPADTQLEYLCPLPVYADNTWAKKKDTWTIPAPKRSHMPHCSLGRKPDGTDPGRLLHR